MGTVELLAVRRDGEWRAQWLVPVATEPATDVEAEAYVDTVPVYVDAETGRVDDRPTPAQGLSTAPRPPTEEAVVTVELPGR